MVCLRCIHCVGSVGSNSDSSSLAPSRRHPLRRCRGARIFVSSPSLLVGESSVWGGALLGGDSSSASKNNARTPVPPQCPWRHQGGSGIGLQSIFLVDSFRCSVDVCRHRQIHRWASENGDSIRLQEKCKTPLARARTHM